MRRHKILLTITLLTLATFCLVGTVIGAKVLLYKEPGFSGDWDNGTGTPPACAYGEYDEDSGKCVYQSTSCAFGEYQQDTGKCQFTRYLMNTAHPNEWDGAESDCEGRGMHLITIMSDVENEALHEYYNFYDIWYGAWIGITDEAEEGNWQWVTGEPVTYTHWRTSEPDNDGEFWHSNADHGLTLGYEWADEDGTYYLRYFMCEWDWEFGATGLCPEGYTYDAVMISWWGLAPAYCSGNPECPEGYEYDQGSGNCIGDPQ